MSDVKAAIKTYHALADAYNFTEIPTRKDDRMFSRISEAAKAVVPLVRPNSDAQIIWQGRADYWQAMRAMIGEWG